MEKVEIKIRTKNLKYKKKIKNYLYNYIVFNFTIYIKAKLYDKSKE